MAGACAGLSHRVVTLESTLTGSFSTQIQSSMYTENNNNQKSTLWTMKSKQTSSELSI